MTIRVPLLPFEVEFRRTGDRPGRVRVRDLMILVALVALGLYAWQTPDRARGYRSVAGSHWRRSNEASFAARATSVTIDRRRAEANALRLEAEAVRSSDLAKFTVLSRLADESDGMLGRLITERTRLQAKARHHLGLGNKYGWASDHALWPVWPDSLSP